MIYYKNTGAGDVDSITIMPTRPPEDKAVLLIPEFKFLRDFDFKNFNYFNFEHSVTDMSPGEFEWWYNGVFTEWLNFVDDNYIDLDIEGINAKFSSQEEKRVFLLKIVNFVMFLLPYQILRGVFHAEGLETEVDAREYLEDDINLINLRNDVIDALDKNMTQFDDFVKTLLHFEKVAKKNLVEENIELLGDHVKKQNLFLEIFKRIIEETDMHKFKVYLSNLFEQDWKNVLG